MTSVQLSLPCFKLKNTMIMFIFAGEPNSPNPPPILTSKIRICHCRGPILSRGPRHNIMAYRASQCFLQLWWSKECKWKRKKSVVYSPAIPHTERASQQITRKQQLPKHWSPPDKYTSTILPCNGRETELGVLKMNCALCANSCATEQKSDFKTDSTLVTETINGQYNT